MVVLPTPEEPTIAIFSPLFIEKLTGLYEKYENPESLDTFKTVVLQGAARLGQNLEQALPEEIARCCPMSADGRKSLDNAAMRCGFSPRAVSSSVKLARTIADMAGCTVIQEAHIKEAIQYRKACTGFLAETAVG